MADGSCDVNGCTGETFMGWAPISEQKGRKVCEIHFRQHDNPNNSFNLWDAFGFERPVHKPWRQIQTVMRRCDCGRALAGRRRFCEICQGERERQRKKRAYHGRKNPDPAPVEDNGPRCKDCGESREVGHRYCPKCAERRRKATRRQAQSRYWQKLQKCQV